MNISALKKKLLAKGLVFSLAGNSISVMFFGVGYCPLKSIDLVAHHPRQSGLLAAPSG
jgi:hypothetical protein